MRIDARAVDPGLPTRPDATARPQPVGPSGDLQAHLSADELAYFAELERMGPLTYGRKGEAAGKGPAPVLGQRIDVRA
jgi:hypothetical protein